MQPIVYSYEEINGKRCVHHCLVPSAEHPSQLLEILYNKVRFAFFWPNIPDDFLGGIKERLAELMLNLPLSLKDFLSQNRRA